MSAYLTQFSRSFVALGAAFVAACSTMPHERAEAPPLPSAWRDAPAGADTNLSDWWKGFNDPTLDTFIDEALRDGPSVQLAAARLREARALSYSTITQYLPQLLATGQGQYTRVNSGPAFSNGEREQMTGYYGAQASWEVPLFRVGALSAGTRGANQSAIADLRGARVALAADVAQAYVDLRAANASRDALQQSVQAADELARITAVGAQAGLTAEADAADARRQAETQRTRLPGLVIESRRAENVLATLRGKAPGTETPQTLAALEGAAPVPSLPLAGAPGAPADLLRLRPDVARAEAQTLIAAAQLGDARANLLPRLNLTGTILQSTALIGSPAGLGSTIGQATPLITIPLFDWGQRLADIRQRDAQFDQSLISYRQTVTEAIADASNALAALDQGRLRLQSARAAEDAAEATARGSRAAYGAGIQSLADRLRAEQQLLEATLSRIDAERQEASAAIATYRAFGGGPALEVH